MGNKNSKIRKKSVLKSKRKTGKANSMKRLIIMGSKQRRKEYTRTKKKAKNSRKSNVGKAREAKRFAGYQDLMVCSEGHDRNQERLTVEIIMGSERRRLKRNRKRRSYDNLRKAREVKRRCQKHEPAGVGLVNSHAYVLSIGLLTTFLPTRAEAPPSKLEEISDMGNKRKSFGMKKRSTVQATQASLKRRKSKRDETTNKSKVGVTRPSKLSVLCKNVIKKYNLVENKMNFGEPSSSTIIGGKLMRDRQKKETEGASSIASRSSKPPKKRKVDKGDAKLSGIIKKRDRPCKTISKIDVDNKIKRRSRKKAFPEISVGIAAINPEPEIRIKVELEPTAAVQDPIGPDDEGYTVIVKEEFEADEDTRLLAQPTATSDTTPPKIVLPTLVCSRNVASTSSSLPSAISGPPLMTVIGDEMQIFANSIAEQLRAFPLDRALLLQLEIQTIIDNERHLLLH